MTFSKIETLVFITVLAMALTTLALDLMVWRAL